MSNLKFHSWMVSGVDLGVVRLRTFFVFRISFFIALQKISLDKHCRIIMFSKFLRTFAFELGFDI